MTSTSPETAKDTAQLLTQEDGYKRIRINFAREVRDAWANQLRPG